MKQAFDSIEAVIEDLRKGMMVIVVDDADRENEGDLIMAATKKPSGLFEGLWDGMEAVTAIL